MYKKSKAQIICDAICGILMLASILVFILVGIFANIWHPTWIVIPCSGIVCGIVSISINTYANLHTETPNTEDKSGDKKDKSTSK